MIDTKDIERRIRAERDFDRLYIIALETCDHIDSQVEENKRLEADNLEIDETASKRQIRIYALTEALNYYADPHWSMVRGGPGTQVAAGAIKPDAGEAT